MRESNESSLGEDRPVVVIAKQLSKFAHFSIFSPFQIFHETPAQLGTERARSWNESMAAGTRLLDSQTFRANSRLVESMGRREPDTSVMPKAIAGHVKPGSFHDPIPRGWSALVRSPLTSTRSETTVSLRRHGVKQASDENRSGPATRRHLNLRSGSVAAPTRPCCAGGFACLGAASTSVGAPGLNDQSQSSHRRTDDVVRRRNSTNRNELVRRFPPKT